MASRNLKKAITLIKNANKDLAKANELLSETYDGWVSVYPSYVSVTMGLDNIAKELGSKVDTTILNSGKGFDASCIYEDVSFREYAVPISWMDRYTGGAKDV